MAVTATLLVDFAANAATSEGLLLEIDDRESGLNGGETSFRPGDEAYYLMYLAGLTLQQHHSNAGSISSQGSGARAVSGVDALSLGFAKEKEKSLSYPATGGLTSWEWIGTVRDADDQVITGPTPEIVADGRTLRTAEKVTGILKLEYNAPYDAYRLSAVPSDIEQVQIFAEAE